MKTIEIKGIKENIIERTDFPPEKLKQILGKETITILGYGPQGRGQGLNFNHEGSPSMQCRYQCHPRTADRFFTEKKP